MTGLTRRACAALGVVVLGWACGDSIEVVSGVPAASLAVIAGDAQTGVVGKELPVALVARVLDSLGRAVQGVTVSFKVTAGGGSMFAGVGASNDTGVVQDRWTLGTHTSDSQRVEVRVVDAGTGEARVLGAFSAIPVPDVPATLTRVSGDTQVMAVGYVLKKPLVVLARDQYRNAIPNHTVSWSTNGGGTLPDSSITDVDGHANADWILGPDASLQTASAAARGLSGSPVVFNATGGGVTQITLVSGSTNATVATAVATPPTVQVSWLGARTIKGVQVTFTATSSNGTVTGASATTDSTGVATLGGWTLGTGSGTQRLTVTAARAQDHPAPLTVTITANPGAATKTGILAQPSNTAFGVRYPFLSVVTAAIQDQYGNTITSSTAPITLTIANNAGAATLSGNGPISAVAGVASFPALTLDQAGTGYTLSAQSAGLANASPSSAFTVSAVGVVAVGPVLSSSVTPAIVDSTLYFLSHSPSGGFSDNRVWRTLTEGGQPFVIQETGLSASQSLTTFGTGVAALHITSSMNNIPRMTYVVTPSTAAVDFGIILSTGNTGALRDDLEFDGTSFVTPVRNFGSLGGPAASRSLMRLTIGVGKTTLASDSAPGTDVFRAMLALDGGQLYYTDTTSKGTGIKVMPATGGSPTTIIDSVNLAVGAGRRRMAVANGIIYWADQGNGSAGAASIVSMPTGGGTVTPRVTGLGPILRDFLIDGSFLYAAVDTALIRVNLNDFSVTTIDHGDSVDGIAIAGNAVYWGANHAAAPKFFGIKKAHK